MNSSVLSDFTVALLGLPRQFKRAILILVDMGLCCLSVWLAYYLRLGDWIPLTGSASVAAAGSLMLAIPVFMVTGVYGLLLRRPSSDLLRVLTLAGAIYLVAYASVFTTYGVTGVPRTVGIIQPLLLFLTVLGARFAAALFLDSSRRSSHGPIARKVLIYGAGSAGRQLASVIADGGSMRVVGFVDDDRTLQGSKLAGVKVYPSDTLETVIDRLGAHDVLLAIPSATRQRRNEILEQLRTLSVNVQTLPNLLDLARGVVTVSDVRELSVDDLLSRGPVAPDDAWMRRNIQGQVVMVTGAGGSIGSELCRQILAAGPRRVLLVESSEFALYSIAREIERLAPPGIEVIPLLGSVVSRTRMREIFAAWRPQQVFHAAAYKHVPLVEHNPLEGLRNNSIGTMIVAMLAAEHGASGFVLVSTDKAVRSTNTMGASKRLAELVLQALASVSPDTCFSMVRFGNVLGSSGSVVPLFREQIRNGGPVTITHPEITRYFMTIPEAAQLVVQAGAMAQGGEVFVLDMGKPVKIVDLASRMIALSGATLRDAEHPHGDIEIKFVGLRPGEKLYEELLIGNDPRSTSHPRIMMATEASIPWEVLAPRMAELEQFVDQRDVAGARTLLLDLVPEFAPTNAIEDWVYLAAGGADTERTVPLHTVC